jgi:hypothetical protein
VWSSTTDSPAYPFVSADGSALYLRTSVYRAEYWLRERVD